MESQGIVKYCPRCKRELPHEVLHYSETDILNNSPFVNIEKKDLYCIMKCSWCYKKSTNDPSLIYKHQDKRHFVCEKCNKLCIGYNGLRDHFCKDNLFILEDYLEKARKEYHETGSITPEKACILLNCKPAQDLIIQAIQKLFLSTEIKDTALSLLKKIEKEKGIGQRLSPPKMGASCLYIACLLNKKHHSQKIIAPLFKITESTLRGGLKLLRATKMYKEIEKELLYNNQEFNYNSNLMRKGFTKIAREIVNEMFGKNK